MSNKTVDIEQGTSDINQNNSSKFDLRRILTIFWITFSIGIVLIVSSIISGNIIDDFTIKLTTSILLLIFGLCFLLGSIIYLILSRNWRKR